MVLNEMRHLTKLYMARHGMSQQAMGKLLKTTQTAVWSWAFSPKPSVLSEETLDRLVKVLRKDGLMVGTISTSTAVDSAFNIAESAVKRIGRPLKSVSDVMNAKKH